MSADEHFNAEGGIPPEVDDHQPTDMPATVGIVVMIGVVALVGVVVVLLVQFLG